MKTAVLLFPAIALERLVALAARVEALGYDDFWLADERFFRDVYVALTACALATERVRIGPCVTDPYSRHPALTAMAIGALDEISNRRAALGIGAGVSGFRELGIEATRSAVAMRETIDLVRRLLAGETVSAQGEQVALHGGRLGFEPPRPAVPIYVASQRRAGCRLAGRVADGAMMQGCVAAPLLEFFRATVAEGARRAGRDPASIELVARLNVCVDDDHAAARDALRPGIVRSLGAQSRDLFSATVAGVEVPAGLRARIETLGYTHDAEALRALAPQISDTLVDALTLAGPPDRIAAELVRLAQGGIARVVIFPVAVDGRIETTLERFAREVVPRVREGLRPPA